MDSGFQSLKFAGFRNPDSLTSGDRIHWHTFFISVKEYKRFYPVIPYEGQEQSKPDIKVEGRGGYVLRLQLSFKDDEQEITDLYFQHE